MVTGFHHVCVKTRDWDATMRFYCDVLGCTPKVAWRSAPERAVMLQIPGAQSYVEVFEDLRYQPQPNGSILHFALRTDRLDQLVERIRAAGLKITIEPKNVTIPNTTSVGPVPVRIFFCEGPNGEIVEFMQNELT
jgi:glyoxylase I family protein